MSIGSPRNRSSAGAPPAAGPRRRARLRLPLAAFLVSLAALFTAGCLPPLLDPPTSGLTYGKGPLDAIRDAADRTTTSGPWANCGLNSTDLAAMMMVPTYFEAGGSTPGPMTLSRWDNVSVWSINVNLFPFAQTSGPYVNAFFSPGIGLWQFDSAGGWDLTAADAIDTVTAANTAAVTMARGWCNAPPSMQTTPQDRRKAAWAPWFWCSFGNWKDSCQSRLDTFEARFQQLVTNGSLNTAWDASVDRYGGMQQRTCDIFGLGTGLTCWYVNPANAQGSRVWSTGLYDPGNPSGITPLPKPFYVVRANGREYRFWIKADTGYDIGITASHPVTTNVRTSIVWERSALLCDTTAYRGECGSAPPTGFIDAVTAGTNSVRVTGWAFDRDTTSPLSVHVYVGPVGTAITTGGSRSDVASAFPGAPGNSGFDATIDAAVGPQHVCVYAIDVGGGSGNVELGCRDVTVTGTPRGTFDAVTPRPGSIDVAGWSVLPGDPSSVAIVSVDGEVRGRLARTVARPDVQAAVAGAELVSGFSGTVPASAGRHTVCLTAGPAPLGALGCRSVELPAGSPIGVVDAISARPGAVAIAGWAIDPDSTSSIAVHVYVSSTGSALTADVNRPDIAAAFPAYGAAHGYSAVLAAPPGRSTVCAYGINIGVGSNVLLGCRTVDVPTGSPIGVIDALVRDGGSVVGSGWAIDPDSGASIPVHVYVGTTGTALMADVNRPDIAATFPSYGAAHGFRFTVPAPAGSNVCVYAIDVGGTGGNRLLGCRTL